MKRATLHAYIDPFSAFDEYKDVLNNSLLAHQPIVNEMWTNLCYIKSTHFWFLMNKTNSCINLTREINH